MTPSLYLTEFSQNKNPQAYLRENQQILHVLKKKKKNFFECCHCSLGVINLKNNFTYLHHFQCSYREEKTREKTFSNPLNFSESSFSYHQLLH